LRIEGIASTLNHFTKDPTLYKDRAASDILNFTQVWPLYLNVLTAMSCLLLSSIFHTFHSQSKEVQILLVSFDYAGISILILGSAFSPCYYSFACGEAVYWGYLMNSFMVFTCGLSFYLAVHPDNSHGKAMYIFRMIVFLAAGISGLVPMTVNKFYEPAGDVLKFSHSLIYLGGLFYIVGVLMYGFHVPERYCPGKLDIVGASH
jgi:adiponectin receptor